MTFFYEKKPTGNQFLMLYSWQFKSTQNNTKSSFYFSCCDIEVSFSLTMSYLKNMYMNLLLLCHLGLHLCQFISEIKGLRIIIITDTHELQYIYM